jgi:hypothetical protein
MPRPERPLDPSSGPIQAFASELRKLREDAGNPKYLQMARQSGKSRTALAEAAGGDHLATWETVAAFVTACGGDPATWRMKWEVVRDEVRKSEPIDDNKVGQSLSSAPPDVATHIKETLPLPEPTPNNLSSRRWRQVALLMTMPALIGAAAGAGVTVLLVRQNQDQPVQNPAVTSTSSSSPVSAHSSVIITVQNKVALGADRLIEDPAGPVSLCAKAVPYCTRQGFKLEGTDMSSGAQLVANCQTTGAEMFNYNLDSSESKNNPHRADSSLWYRAKWPDSRSGFISEVYIVPEDRSGKGLPTCQ